MAPQRLFLVCILIAFVSLAFGSEADKEEIRAEGLLLARVVRHYRAAHSILGKKKAKLLDEEEGSGFGHKQSLKVVPRDVTEDGSGFGP